MHIIYPCAHRYIMAKLKIHDSTIARIEEITGRKLRHGGDKMFNDALDILQQEKIKN